MGPLLQQAKAPPQHPQEQPFRNDGTHAWDPDGGEPNAIPKCGTGGRGDCRDRRRDFARIFAGFDRVGQRRFEPWTDGVVVGNRARASRQRVVQARAKEARLDDDDADVERSSPSASDSVQPLRGVCSLRRTPSGTRAAGERAHVHDEPCAPAAHQAALRSWRTTPQSSYRKRARRLEGRFFASSRALGPRSRGGRSGRRAEHVPHGD